MSILKLLIAALGGLVSGRAALMAENLALRQELNVLQRSVKRPFSASEILHKPRIPLATRRPSDPHVPHAGGHDGSGRVARPPADTVPSE